MSRSRWRLAPWEAPLRLPLLTSSYQPRRLGASDACGRFQYTKGANSLLAPDPKEVRHHAPADRASLAHDRREQVVHSPLRQQIGDAQPDNRATQYGAVI